MSRGSSWKNESRSAGSALVELVFVVPVLVVMLFGGIEYTRSLRMMSSLTNASKDITVNGVRRCVSATPYANCLTTGVNHVYVSHAGQGMLDGMRLTMSVWVYNAGVCAMVMEAHQGVNFTAPFLNYNQPQLNATDPDYLAICQTEGSIILGEAAAEFKPLMPGISSLFGFGNKVLRVKFIG